MARYVDADTAFTTANEAIDDWDGGSNLERTDILRKAMDTIPTADVREVVHSKWIQNDNGTWSCMRCHSWIPNEQHEYARYCLYCGAEM